MPIVGKVFATVPEVLCGNQIAESAGRSMTAAAIVAAQPISAIWIALGGDVPRHGRARAFYRNGDNPQAVSLNDAKACWYDHRDHVGGGILDLIQLVRCCNRLSALRWLAEFAGLQLDDRSFGSTGRKEYGRWRTQAKQLAQDVADFAHGLELALRQRQQRAADMTMRLLEQGKDPGAVLIDANRDLIALRQAEADSLVRTYLRMPARAQRGFVGAGRQDRAHAERVTWTIVEMLADCEISEVQEFAP
jgi:hypothetical protein